MILRKWMKAEIEEIQKVDSRYKSTINIKKLFHDFHHSKDFFPKLFNTKRPIAAIPKIRGDTTTGFIETIYLTILLLHSQ